LYIRVRLVTSNSSSLYNYTKQKRWKYYCTYPPYYSLFSFLLSVQIIVAEPATHNRLPKSLVQCTTPIATNTSSARTLSYNTDRTITVCGVEIILTTLLLNWVYSNAMKSRFSLFAVYVCTNTIYTSCTSIKTLHAIHQSILWSFPFRLVLYFTCRKSDNSLNSNSLWSTDEIIRTNNYGPPTLNHNNIRTVQNMCIVQMYNILFYKSWSTKWALMSNGNISFCK